MADRKMRVHRPDTPAERDSLEEYRTSAWKEVGKHLHALCNTRECWDLWPLIGGFVQRLGAVVVGLLSRVHSRGVV